MTHQEKEYKWITILFCAVLGVLTICSLFRFMAAYDSDNAQNNDWNITMGSHFETDYAVNFAGKMQLIDLNGGMRSLLSIPEMNGVIKLQNGYLTFLYDDLDDATLQTYASELARTNTILNARGIDFLYVATPYSVCKYDQQLPIGYTDNRNPDLDSFLETLDTLQVPYIDMRAEIYRDGRNQYDLWYRSDHHWTTDAGFYAFTKIATYLQEHTELHISEQVLSPDNYRIETYPAWHLGSMGQRTGIFYGGIDDFRLYYPTYATSFDDGASFAETLYDLTPLQNRNYESRYTYDDVLRPCFYQHQNLESTNQTKILFLCDSMGKAILPFMNLAFAETRFMSPWDLSTDVLDCYQPDLVIMLLHPSNLENPQYYNLSAIQ